MSEKKEGKEESEDGKRKEKGGNRKCGRRRRDIIERPLLLPLLLLHEWTAIYVSWEEEGGRGQQEGCNFLGVGGARMGCLPIFSPPSGSAHYRGPYFLFRGEEEEEGGPLGHVLPHPGGSALQRNFVRLG